MSIRLKVTYSPELQARLAALDLKRGTPAPDAQPAREEPRQPGRPVVGERAGNFQELADAFEAECRRLRAGIEQALQLGRDPANGRRRMLRHLKSVRAAVRMP